jgi:DNA topoisomerase-1
LNKKPNERLFGVSEQKANAYLKEHMGNFKMKDLRTMMGTDLALKFIADPGNDIQQPKTVTELNRIKKQVAAHVAENLGNTPAVALSAYIDPAIWETWEEAFDK